MLTFDEPVSADDVEAILQEGVDTPLTSPQSSSSPGRTAQQPIPSGAGKVVRGRTSSSEDGGPDTLGRIADDRGGETHAEPAS